MIGTVPSAKRNGCFGVGEGDAKFEGAYGTINFHPILKKMMFMKNGWVPNAPFAFNGTNISSYVYLVHEVNMMNDLATELCKRERAA